MPSDADRAQQELAGTKRQSRRRAAELAPLDIPPLRRGFGMSERCRQLDFARLCVTGLPLARARRAPPKPITSSR